MFIKISLIKFWLENFVGADIIRPLFSKLLPLYAGG